MTGQRQKIGQLQSVGRMYIYSFDDMKHILFSYICCDIVYTGIGPSPLTLCHTSSMAATAASLSLPFLIHLAVSPSWSRLLPPIISASPCSLLSSEWYASQRYASSAADTFSARAAASHLARLARYDGLLYML